MFNKLRVQNKLYAGIVAILALFLLLLVTAYNNFTSLVDANRWDRHTLEVLTAASRLESTSYEIRSEYRGYLLTGDEAFDLHATYGFPIGLTKIIGAERGVAVDVQGFERKFEEHQTLSNALKGEDTSLTTLPPDAIAKLQGEKIPPTNDQYKYSGDPLTATVQAIWDGAKLVNETSARAAVILNHTNFYAEMGGQVGDTGEIAGEGGLWHVVSTQKAGAVWLHFLAGNEAPPAGADAPTLLLASALPAVAAAFLLSRVHYRQP